MALVARYRPTDVDDRIRDRINYPQIDLFVMADGGFKQLDNVCCIKLSLMIPSGGALTISKTPEIMNPVVFILMPSVSSTFGSIAGSRSRQPF